MFEEVADYRAKKALSGFLLTLVPAAILWVWLVERGGLPWPFHGAGTVAGTYGRMLAYLPVFGFSMASLLWMRGAGPGIIEYFKWKGGSLAVWGVAGLSAGYSLFLFLSHDFVYKPVAFLPPALGVGLLNAVSEEILFRLAFLSLLTRVNGFPQRANLMQAVAYGLVHLFIGGPVFFFGAVAYGLLLGWITQARDSILPAIVCHFIADIGAIVLPLMIYGVKGVYIGSF